jgi:hypothetical protein
MILAVAVEKDHRGGTTSEESDVTDNDRKKGNDGVSLGCSGRTTLSREQCDVLLGNTPRD